MKLKDFALFEEEIAQRSQPEREPTRGEREEAPKTKDMKLGELKDGTEVMCKMKVGHTIVLDYHEFYKLRKMAVTRSVKEMLPHYRGGRDYRISKEKDGSFEIFHYNKTIHELTPVGVFELPEKRDMSLKESVKTEFAFFTPGDKKKDENLMKKLRVHFPDIAIGGREVEGKSLFVGTSDLGIEGIMAVLGTVGIKKEAVYTF